MRVIFDKKKSIRDELLSLPTIASIVAAANITDADYHLGTGDSLPVRDLSPLCGPRLSSVLFDMDATPYRLHFLDEEIVGITRSRRGNNYVVSLPTFHYGGVTDARLEVYTIDASLACWGKARGYGKVVAHTPVIFQCLERNMPSGYSMKIHAKTDGSGELHRPIFYNAKSISYSKVYPDKNVRICVAVDDYRETTLFGRTSSIFRGKVYIGVGRYDQPIHTIVARTTDWWNEMCEGLVVDFTKDFPISDEDLLLMIGVNTTHRNGYAP